MKQKDVLGQTGGLERHPDDGWTLAVHMMVGARVRRVLSKLIDAIIPPSPRTETTVEDIADHALTLLQYMPRSSAMVFLLGMHLLNWAPLWRFRGLRPLTSLSADAARRHLVGVTRSRWLPVRLLMYGPLGLFMSTYFDQDYVHREMSYDPVPFVEERIALRRKWVEGTDPDVTVEIRHRPLGMR